MKDPLFREATEKLDRLSADAAVQRMARAREDAQKMYRLGLRESKAEGKIEGKIEGMAQEAAEAVLRVLATRKMAVPGEIRDRILACEDLALLRSWLDRAVVAASVDQIIDD